MDAGWAFKVRVLMLRQRSPDVVAAGPPSRRSSWSLPQVKQRVGNLLGRSLRRLPPACAQCAPDETVFVSQYAHHHSHGIENVAVDRARGKQGAREGGGYWARGWWLQLYGTWHHVAWALGAGDCPCGVTQACEGRHWHRGQLGQVSPQGSLLYGNARQHLFQGFAYAAPWLGRGPVPVSIGGRCRWVGYTTYIVQGAGTARVTRSTVQAH